ncbi:MAG: hypothetical protein ABIB98_02965 [bacterium]
MSKKKDKKYRRKIEALKAQMSTQVGTQMSTQTSTKVLPSVNKQETNLPGADKDVTYTSIATVKKEVIKSLLLSLICFSIIIAAYIFQR